MAKYYFPKGDSGDPGAPYGRDIAGNPYPPGGPGRGTGPIPVGGVGSSPVGGGRPAIPSVGGSGFDRTGGNSGPMSPGGTSSGGVTDWLKDNWQKIIPLGLDVWGAYEGHKQDKRSEAMERKALEMAERRYAEMAPLRERAMAGLQNAERPDLSSITADSGNPYAVGRRIPRVGRGA